MKEFKYSTIVFPIFLFLLESCGTSTPKKAETNPDSAAKSPTSIRLSKEQIESAGLETGQIENLPLSGMLAASGILDVPPQNIVSISVPIGGYIRKIEMLEGMHVHKGDLLAVIENPDYIQMQQDYMDYSNQLEFAKADYERQQDLAKDKVNTEKTVQQAKSVYKSIQAKVLGLREKLQLLHLPVSAVDDGKFQSTVELRAPLDAYVSMVNFNTGQFANPADVILKLVDTRHVHAEITVYEKDISLLKKGQLVLLYLPHEPIPREAKVFLIGKSIGPNRDIRVHCHLEKEDVELLPGMFLKAEIQTEGAMQSAVPEHAILSHNDREYLFMETAKEPNGGATYSFVQVERKGGSKNGFAGISLPENVNLNLPVVVKNARSLLGAMFNTEEE